MTRKSLSVGAGSFSGPGPVKPLPAAGGRGPQFLLFFEYNPFCFRYTKGKTEKGARDYYGI